MSKRITSWLILTLTFALLVPLALVASASAAGAPYVGPELVISDLAARHYMPSVAYNWKHREYLVVWHNTWTMGTRDIRARRISDRGEILAEFTIYEHPTRDSAQPSVAYDPVNDRYLVVWVFDAFGDGSDWDLYGRFIPWQGPNPALQEFSIVTWNTKQWNPKLVYARAQEEFMVTWWNEPPAPLKAYISGKRIYADGSGFPTTGSDFTIHDANQPRVEPDISYNLARNEYLVVYSHAQFDIFGMRLRADGVKLGGGEFGIAAWPDPESNPAVAACREADQYLVTWQSNQGGNFAIYARFVNGNGAVGSVHQIRNTTSPDINADVACDQAGGQYMVTWQTRYTNHAYGIWGRLVQPNAAMSDPFPIRHADSASHRTNPAIAGGNTNYLVVWEHERGGAAHLDVHGKLIAPNIVFQPMLMR